MPSEHTAATPPVPPLTSLYLYLSSGCNLACKHCWISPEYLLNPDKGEYLKYEYIESAVEQAKPLGLQSVKLTGGEPFLHPHIQNIITFLKQESVPIQIETNGILIGKELAEFLSKGTNKPFIAISLDGVNEQTHEKLRGVKGCYKLSIEAIKHLVKYNIHPQIIFTIHRGNLNQIEEIIHLAERLECESIKFNMLQDMGRGSDFIKNQGITIEESLKTYEHVERIKNDHNKLRIVFDIPIAFYPIKRFIHENIGKCHVKNIISILASGQISLCGVGTTVDEFVFGHLEKDKLFDVWTNNKNILTLRSKIPHELEGICKNCVLKDYCLGCCVANNYFRTKNLTSSYVFCEEADKIGVFPVSRKIYQNIKE